MRPGTTVRPRRLISLVHGPERWLPRGPTAVKRPSWIVTSDAVVPRPSIVTKRPLVRRRSRAPAHGSACAGRAWPRTGIGGKAATPNTAMAPSQRANFLTEDMRQIVAAGRGEARLETPNLQLPTPKKIWELGIWALGIDVMRSRAPDSRLRGSQTSCW